MISKRNPNFDALYITSYGHYADMVRIVSLKFEVKDKVEYYRGQTI